MTRTSIVIAVTALGLAACAQEPDDAADPPVEQQHDAEIEAEPEVGVMPGQDDLFSVAFEGVWRFEGPTEAAVVVEPDADAGAVADHLAGEDGVIAVDRAGDAEIDDRGDLAPFFPPDAPTPPVLLVAAEDQQAAAALTDAVQRDDVRLVFAPTCGALAGTARHHGIDQAQTWLDEAACDEVAIIHADPDAAHPWVAAVGVQDGEICIGTAAPAAAMSMCHPDPDAPGARLATGAGGFVFGIAPPETDRVDIDDGAETVTVAPVALQDTLAYAVHVPGPDAAPDVVEAPDHADVSVRFLDAEGEVLEEA